GRIDTLLRAVADDDATAGVLITDAGLQRIYHPYDGGVDVMLTTNTERDQLRSRHTDWLSAHPAVAGTRASAIRRKARGQETPLRNDARRRSRCPRAVYVRIGSM
ncbi:hypothetical protein ABZ345_42640, partial [Lentzea sp. NPDC005914]